MNTKRDSKDPMPTADNTQREGGGNDPEVAGEKHGQKKAQRVSVESRFNSNPSGPEQPHRTAGDGNTPVGQVIENHNQKKSERVKASQRF